MKWLVGIALVRKERGGRTGGRTALTAEGKKWLTAYGTFRGEIEKAVDKEFKRHFKGLIK